MLVTHDPQRKFRVRTVKPRAPLLESQSDNKMKFSTELFSTHRSLIALYLSPFLFREASVKAFQVTPIILIKTAIDDILLVSDQIFTALF